MEPPAAEDLDDGRGGQGFHRVAGGQPVGVGKGEDLACGGLQLLLVIDIDGRAEFGAEGLDVFVSQKIHGRGPSRF